MGQQYRSAIESYRLAGGVNQYPRRLDDLLQDPRLPTIKRHLRRLYPDPITGQSTWGIVKAPDGGILGVFSLSTQEPLKTASRPAGLLPFNATSPVQPVLTPTAPLAGLAQTTSDAQASEPLPPDPPQYTYRDWKFIVTPNVVGTSGARAAGGG